MRRLVVALALVGLVSVPLPAAGDAAAYAHPGNAGVMHPFGPALVLETAPIDFRASKDYTQFSVEAIDWLRYPVWMKVCLFYANVCMRTAEGDDRVVIDATPGTVFGSPVVARVYVYSAHAWADGDTSAATWGGLRAKFDGGVSTIDVVPYLASGYAGHAVGFPINLRVQCGFYVSAQCVTAPVAARTIRIDVVDAVAPTTYFEACTFTPSGARIACVPASNTAQMGAVPLGGKIDVRPYNMLIDNVKGTKGHVKVQYFV